MPGAIVEPPDVGAAWSGVARSLSWDLFDAAADVGAAGAIAGDGAGIGTIIIGAAVADNPVVDIAGIIIGVALLIVAFAIGVLLLRPLGWLLGHIPFVGGAIEDALDNASNAVWNFISGLVGDALRGIWWFLQLLWSVTLGFPMAVGKALVATASFVHWVANTQVPWAVGVAQDDANQAQANAENYAADVGNWAVGIARSLFGQAVGYAQQLWQNAVEYAQSLYNQAIGFAQAVEHEATAYTSEVYNAVEADLSNGLRAVESWTGQLFQQAENDIRWVEQEAQQELGAAVQQLTGLFTGELTQTQALLGGEIAGVAAAAATATATVEQKLQKYLDDCGTPICDNLSDLSNSIPQLLDLFDDAAIAALIYDLIHNPTAVADDVHEFVVTPMQEAAKLAGVA